MRLVRYLYTMKSSGFSIAADVTAKNPYTIGPGPDIKYAMPLRPDKKISCLSAVENDELV